MYLSECYRSDVSVHGGGSDDPSRTADTERTGTTARLSSNVQLTGMYYRSYYLSSRSDTKLSHTVYENCTE